MRDHSPHLECREVLSFGWGNVSKAIKSDLRREGHGDIISESEVSALHVDLCPHGCAVMERAKELPAPQNT